MVATQIFLGSKMLPASLHLRSKPSVSQKNARRVSLRQPITASYDGELQSKQFLDHEGIIKNEITHYENGKKMATFDRVVLGGHEPSHHLSAGILQQLGVETGRIFGIWNENAVSSFLAGTKIYPKDSYAYKSIGLHNRENFIKFNYYFLNLKHLSKLDDFRDHDKVIVTNPQEKLLWQQELDRIYPDADKNLTDLVKAAQLLNKIGMKINSLHPQILNLADYVVNGRQNMPSDKILDGKKLFYEHGQEMLVDDTTNDKNSILGIRQWEQNPQKITSQIVDLKKTIENVNELSRKARSSGEDINLDEFRKIFHA